MRLFASLLARSLQLSRIRCLVRRLHAVDCERASSNEDILDARRNKLATSLLEYEVHGKFKVTDDGRAFPDTYFFTVSEMHDAGMSKDDIRRVMKRQEKALAAANEAALLDVPSDEEEPESLSPEA